MGADFAVGALVRARGREWVVLGRDPEDEQVLRLRPLGGRDDEIAGILVGDRDDPVEPAEFPLPDPDRDRGNYLSCRLLRDAVRLGFRSGAGPLRCLARIAVEPRPYQLVPLLMALRQDPVRLMIADDVGIGKTVEACLVARELWDRGEIHGLTVLCPPHLAEQWQAALVEQFHLDAVLVLPGTAARLERQCRQDESIFRRWPVTVVSLDYIKTERHREEFLLHCPELVIVDEAHGCAASARAAQQRRHQLLRDLVDPDRPGGADRHLLLVTATPHSGKQEAFRSLLSLLDPELANLPEDLSGEENRSHRERLARYLVQRRRIDLEHYLGTDTPFPHREAFEISYRVGPAWKSLYEKVLRFCRESVLDEQLGKPQQRVRWWAALGMLRALSSSPRAAAATLRSRAPAAAGETVEEVDELGARSVLDLDEESTEGIDVVPGAETGEEGEQGRLRKRFLALAREAERLAGKEDRKLAHGLEVVRKLVDDGFSPIVFCRFIETAEYVAEHFREKLGNRGVEVAAVTGKLPPEERERRVHELGAHPKKVLVCTDCLSEGINLQEFFDAVVHYDLAWNPTRHEQREGRVDRYGQRRDEVRTVTFFGQDNPVDGIVLEVLLRKHRTIRQQLGILVPVPADERLVGDAILEGLLLREETGGTVQREFGFMEEFQQEVAVEWERAAAREKRSRTLFAQNRLLREINERVVQELAEARRAIGGHADTKWFVTTALGALGASVTGDEPVEVDLEGVRREVRDALGDVGKRFAAVFGRPPGRGELHLVRTHPLVAGLASLVFEAAMDPDSPVERVAGRCGVVRTAAVSRRTTLLLVRMRFHLVGRGRGDRPVTLLVEDLGLTGFEGGAGELAWLDRDAAERLLEAPPAENVPDQEALRHLERILARIREDDVADRLAALAGERGEELLAAHRRVRQAARTGVRGLRVEPHLPPDLLGVFVLLPAGGGA